METKEQMHYRYIQQRLWEGSITIEQAETLIDKLFGRSNGKS
jgi:hypothetical protein